VLLKPFEDGICIEEDLTLKHRLLFSKFPDGKKHLLIATKEPEKQSDMLNVRDFEAILIA
jgi:ATP adenylyltransferase/5',5'''-P-1,P-4-tetraphosphate phosphorylase II